MVNLPQNLIPKSLINSPHVYPWLGLLKYVGEGIFGFFFVLRNVSWGERYFCFFVFGNVTNVPFASFFRETPFWTWVIKINRGGDFFVFLVFG
ncbi:hypothetical protein C1646_713953 [Rhizophagus diaphanus]|nr:hypothetical protein C1646_713953 [Rhizophagus diaphanus] [Rhizophagus sp. MUCL 43196]